ncbi:hypothetical protein TNCT_453441 [Trichonephila clavata]|uniref:Uncharacterized protein n=1 Tax=Trichonephila clavata TaxID=2740835 RepID=A0A8X6LW96_TRICU|nr:hypothetical protein TNCT_453441 [Trichonephila clavata]
MDRAYMGEPGNRGDHVWGIWQRVRHIYIEREIRQQGRTRRGDQTKPDRTRSRKKAAEARKPETEKRGWRKKDYWTIHPEDYGML